MKKKKYVQVSSVRLVTNEKKALTKSAIFLCLSTVKLSIHMLTDYSLWWILKMIRYHGRFQTNVDTPSNIKVIVDGKGMLADLYSSILSTFQPSGIKFDLDTTPCLPDPIPPDIPRYRQIASLMVLAWILSICEPYGLRLRNSAMGYYYPARARVRAIWLYNHILRSRGSFLKYARRQLRRLFVKDGKGVEQISFMDRLRASFPCLQKICKGKEISACLLCGGVGSSKLPLMKCPRPDCIGAYCVPCYGQLQNICTLCKLPIEYGDLSDISEERDSSDEIASSIPSKGSEDEVSTDESDTTGALLHDTAESEISIDYQFKERDISVDNSQIPPAFQDIEAQKPRSRATLKDYAFPIEHHPEEEEHKMTLAQRKRSGIWSLIPDPDNVKKSVLKNNENLSAKSEIQDLRSSNISAKAITLGKVPEGARTSQQGSVRKMDNIPELEEGAGSEISESDVSEGETSSSQSISKREKAKRKLFNFPKMKRFYRKGKTDKTGKKDIVTEEKEYDLTKPLLSLQGSKTFKRKISDAKTIESEGKKLSYEHSRTSIKKKTDEEQGKDQGGKSDPLPPKISKDSKSLQLVENWIKTGSYHSLGELQRTSDRPSRIKQAAAGLKNFFKRIYPKTEKQEDLENVAIHKSPSESRSNKKKLKLKKQAVAPKLKVNRLWNFWKKEKAEADQTTGSETSNEENKKGEKEGAENKDPLKTDKFSVGKKTIQHISIMTFEKEAFISKRKAETSAKIVHERFKIDEFYL